MHIQRANPLRERRWLVGISLLLAMACLYNPFFTIYSDCDVPHVHHPLSYRGTVAASELRRCTIDPATPQVPTIEALSTWERTLHVAVTADVAFVVHPERQIVPAVQQVFLDSLWFRPPPAL